MATNVATEDPDFTGRLLPGWPVADIEPFLFTIIGLGSIGSVAADAIADYGGHRFALVDPDRLLDRNLVRHRAARRLLGQYKVHAVRDTLRAHRSYLDIATFSTSVVNDADRMRSLFRSSSIVICCADGIQARTVSSHLARWANVPIVLACVLDDGAIGEVIRLRPSRRIGCLRCQRSQARASGHIDPEPGLELPYGTGDSHRPMTAVGGDLALVGHLAAKVAVATLLEATGHADQRLPGDHQIVALRPMPDAAYPFDLPRAGDTRWRAAAPPQSDCPTCRSNA
jgi:molybdopterin/thiamine biosynthesis adenylyltransferase